MKYLIAGLGNIGPEYELTRHNIGFLVLDFLAGKFDADFKSDRLAFKCEVKHKGRSFHLIKPTTYMNLSGKAVNYWMKQLKIPKENILVITDDVSLPFARLRMRAKGSSAGHNGLKDIEAATGGNNFARLKFGIGNDYPQGRQVDYVLSNFSKGEFAELETHIERAAEMILSFGTIGIGRTMSQFNS
ncbi:aminoacyl-tRNA hydrolase [Fulvivirgaceae bacterium BMA12]|uniref:Peptidyl-tRNA hydrolase n=1 Tax=Agaribacillus aureus TaxID=3051825 RepID=A0ABT8L2L7_9BACT|nr:aminoacyl-tRNA hydrolase [Fulvivirgaceae bacterium BMA12]